MTPQDLVENGVCPCGHEFEIRDSMLRCPRCGLKVLLKEGEDEV